MIRNTSVKNISSGRAVFIVLSWAGNDSGCLTSRANASDVKLLRWLNKAQKFWWDSGHWIVLVRDVREGGAEL
jgi:hypothetical protein